MLKVFEKEKKIKSLISKHAKFEVLIKKESSRILCDNIKIVDLKKKKLFIRDEIVRLSK